MRPEATPKARVFFSSVMEGYGAFRDAAADAIRRAGCDVVRAEEFPADTTSPRTACLDGVRSADGVVFLLGQRYGYPTPSGKSATEEEYEEARRTHERILVFLEEVTEREPRQEAFVRSIQDYVGGHWRKTFRNASELANLVAQGLCRSLRT